MISTILIKADLGFDKSGSVYGLYGRIRFPSTVLGTGKISEAGMDEA